MRQPRKRESNQKSLNPVVRQEKFIQEWDSNPCLLNTWSNSLPRDNNNYYHLKVQLTKVSQGTKKEQKKKIKFNFLPMNLSNSSTFSLYHFPAKNYQKGISILGEERKKNLISCFAIFLLFFLFNPIFFCSENISITEKAKIVI